MRNRVSLAVLIAFVLPFLPMLAQAQVTVTIGTGTYTNYYPVNYYYYSSVSEALYTAADMSAGGWTGGQGTITHVAWYVSVPYTYANGTLSIYLENTTGNELIGGNFSTGGQLCYTAVAPYFSTAGWHTIALQTPFTYMGGSLGVRVVKAGNDYDYPYAEFAYTNTTLYTHREWSDDVTVPATSGYLGVERPDIRFQILPLGDPLPTITIISAPACYSAPVNQTVTASVTDNGFIADTRIWFRKNAGSWYNAPYTSAIGSTYTYTINAATMGGLVNGDVVAWYVAAQDNNAGVVTSPVGGSGTAPSGSNPPAALHAYNVGTTRTMPYYEAFDGAPSGVTFGGSNSTWRLGAPAGTTGTTAYSGTTALCQQATTGLYLDNDQSWAQLPPMDFTGMANDPVLTFWNKYDYESSWDGLRVEYSTNCGSTWTTLGSYPDPIGVNWYNAASVNSSGGQPVWSGGPMTTWTKSIRTMTGLKGLSGVLVRFRSSTDGSATRAGVVIDDIAIGDFPQKDIEVVDAWLSYAPDRWAHVVNQSHAASVTLRSNGWEPTPTSVSLTLSINGVPVATEMFSPAWVAGQATVTFAQTLTPPATGAIIGSVTATYSGDQVPANNTIMRTYAIVDPKVHGYENVANANIPALPRSWTRLDVNGGVTWQSETLLGEQYLSYPGGQTADDWVFTPAALLQAGSSYRVQFQYRSTSGQQVLDLAYGTSPNPANMTVFETFTFSSATWTNAIGALGVAPFFNTDPTTAQNYYLGFRVRSGAVGALHVDNVMLDVNPTPPPKIGIGLPGTAQGMHIDNIATPIQFSAVYKKAGTVDRTYEVVSTTYNYGAPGDFLWDVTSTTPWIKVVKATPGSLLFLASNPYTPARPRQNQTFTLTVNPTGLTPGVYTGSITLSASLFNSQYPGGIKSTNEPLTMPVILTIVDPYAGGSQNGSQRACLTNLMPSPVPYVFNDANGSPMAAVTVTSGSIPSMCIEAFSSQLPPGIARYRYVQKYFNVTASGTWTANIDWYYTSSEASMGGATRLDLLRVVRQNPSGGVWQDPIPGVSSQSFPSFGYVRGIGYTDKRISGNHCLVTDWFTPKDSETPLAFDLGQNYPNPFNPTTTIDISIPVESHVQLVVLNSVGVEVARIMDEVHPAGVYALPFDARDLPSGLYIYRLTAGGQTKTMHMTVVK